MAGNSMSENSNPENHESESTPRVDNKHSEANQPLTEIFGISVPAQLAKTDSASTVDVTKQDDLPLTAPMMFKNTNMDTVSPPSVLALRELQDQLLAYDT